jgi:hypothetical protein
LVWVFDGDPETKVVCEGYAKAFKYMCELSAFQASVSVSLVTGTLGSSNHMWNLVPVDGGFSYLVDVTNCDEDMAGYPDYLFMAGYSERYQSGGNERPERKQNRMRLQKTERTPVRSQKLRQMV